HRICILRGAEAFIAADQKDKAIALIDKYLEGFPNMNFPYDYNTMLLLNAYVSAGAYDKAKPQLEILANETAQQLTFLQTLDPDQLEPSSEFGRELSFANRTKDEILRVAGQMEDAGFEEKMKKI